MASIYEQMDEDALARTITELEDAVSVLAQRNLSLDMARGKPSPEQVALSRPMLDVIRSDSDLHDGAVDAANYGAPEGLPSARALMADILGVDPDRVIVSGSSSLNLMFDCVAHGYVRGVAGHEPWSRQGTVRFLCPSPGYDRHFAVTEHFGIENVPVPMGAEGPDMDEVERLVADGSVKGIWCVPKYQNPTGVTFSDEVVRRFCALEPAAEDFRIYWDNAYVVHDLVQPGDELLNIFDVLDEMGREDLVYEFASTSKVTFPGSGIACVTASPADLADLSRSFSMERVCSDKMTMLMHGRYFADGDAVRAHMAAQAEVLRPRFEMVEAVLERELDGLGIASWTKPKGGYFVSFDGLPGTAKATVELCGEVGVKLTGAGATWPYGKDPADTNIRLAPSYPTVAELECAMEVLCACAKLVAARTVAEARG